MLVSNRSTEVQQATATIDSAEQYTPLPLSEEIQRVGALLRDDRPLGQLRVWSPLLTGGLLEVVAQTMSPAGYKVVTYVLAACGDTPQIDGLDLPCCIHTAPTLADRLKLAGQTVDNQIHLDLQGQAAGVPATGRLRPNGEGGWRFVPGVKRPLPGAQCRAGRPSGELPDLWAGPK